jgi:hypothetical protein
MIISTNPLVVECENSTCKKQLTLTVNINEMADELQKNGWSWLRGDEAYDHVCSNLCNDKLRSRIKRAEDRRAKIAIKNFLEIKHVKETKT